MTREQKLRWLRLIILIGFVTAVFYHYVLSAYFRLGFPYDTFSSSAGNGYSDYFTPPLLSLFIMCIVFLGFMTCYIWTNVKENNILDTILNTFILLFFTFPVLFSLNTANFEMFVFIFLSLFIYFYQKKKIVPAILFLSLAIAMKGYPAVFVLLLISEKQYKEIFYAILLVMILTLTPMVLFGNGLQDNLATALSNCTSFFSYSLTHLDFNHSIMGLLLTLSGVSVINLNLSLLLGIYSITVLVIFLIISYCLIFRSFYFWEKVTIITLMMCLLPPISMDYKLVHLFIPLFLFVNLKIDQTGSIEESKTEYFLNKSIFDYIIIISFSLLLVPKNYRFFFGFQEGNVLNPLIMIFIAIILLRKAFLRFKLIDPDFHRTN